MSYKIGYFVNNHCESIEDTRWFTTTDCLESPAEFAEEAATWAWDHNDGWEWVRSGTVFTIVSKDIESKEVKMLGDYEIDVDFDPCFYARKTK